MLGVLALWQLNDFSKTAASQCCFCKLLELPTVGASSALCGLECGIASTSIAVAEHEKVSFLHHIHKVKALPCVAIYDIVIVSLLNREGLLRL